MKFSVLLPTRNRLDLLKQAVHTVRNQDYDDWEIIVSDNASEGDVRGYVGSLGDARIRYSRSPSVLPVTENWNRALDAAGGDYVVMLGDDDGLLKGYFRGVATLLADFREPDVLYHGAYILAYPGVLPDFPGGYVLDGTFIDVPPAGKEPFLLDRETAYSLVRRSLSFRMGFSFNMQYFVFRRDLVKRLGDKGPFFQSPYPDYYAANVLFLMADRILVCRKPMTLIGISPKSFGFFYFNRRERQGAEFLRNAPDPETLKELEEVILPGSEMNTSWLLAMERVRKNYGEVRSLPVDYGRYRFVQAVATLSGYYVGKTVRKEQLDLFLRSLRGGERFWFGVGGRIAAYLWGKVPAGHRRKVVEITSRMVGQYPVRKEEWYDRSFRDITEAHEGLPTVDPGKMPGRTGI